MHLLRQAKWTEWRAFCNFRLLLPAGM